MEVLVDINDVCRLCLIDKSKDSSLPMIEIDGSRKSKFEEITQTELQLNYEMPCQICMICDEKLSEMHLYKSQLIQIQQHLKESLQIQKTSETVDTQMIIEEYLEDDLSPKNNLDGTQGYQDEQFECISLPSIKDLKDTSNNQAILKVIEEIQEKNEIILEVSKPQIFKKQKNTKSAQKSHREELVFDKQPPKLIIQPQKDSAGLVLYVNEKKCEICDKNFNSEIRLKKHKLAFHPVKKSIVCCDQVFDLTIDYKQHQKMCHPTLIKCEKCGKELKNKKTFLVHQRSHLTDRKFKCCYCPKAFNFKIHLENHERTHTGEKPFKCELCTASFKQKYQLTVHKRTRHVEPEVDDVDAGSDKDADDFDSFESDEL